jgi:uncharacterized protein (DUF58 family)
MGRHRLLMKWACACARHALPLAGAAVRERLERVLAVADEWVKGNATVGEARKAALAAIAAAREAGDPVSVAVARGAGHAAAAAHMADHALGPALYALKAAKLAGRSAEAERKWQNDRLPPGIRELVLRARKEKESHLRL